MRNIENLLFFSKERFFDKHNLVKKYIELGLVDPSLNRENFRRIDHGSDIDDDSESLYDEDIEASGGFRS